MACSPERVQRKVLISCLFRSPGFVVPDTAVFEVVQDGSFIKAVFYSPAWRGALSGRSTALGQVPIGSKSQARGHFEHFYYNAVVFVNPRLPSSQSC